jgi:hypothetical protein
MVITTIIMRTISEYFTCVPVEKTEPSSNTLTSMPFTVEIFAPLLLAHVKNKAHSDIGATLPIGPAQLSPKPAITS